MERTYIENGRRSTSKENTRRNPCRKEKPRSTVEKMERRTGLNKPPAYMKRRRREEDNIFNFRVHFSSSESEDFYISRKSSVFWNAFLYPWIT